MATPLAANPTPMVRDSEQLLGTTGAPLLSSQITVGGTVYSFVPKKAGRVVFIVFSAAGSTFTLKAGAYPPALASGNGDYTTAGTGANGFLAITVDPSRHMQADGSIQFSTAAAGVVWVLQASA